MWEITAIAHGLLVVAYLWIAYLIGKGQTREHQWASNPIATATFAIFLTCAIGHGIHMEHALLENVGIEAEVGVAAQTAMGDPLLVVWTPITVLAAIWYLTKRKRLRILQGGAPLVEDMVKRQEEARILHDQVMEGVRAAQAHLISGDRDAARAAIAESLAGSEEIITALLGRRKSVHAVRPGDLRRARSSQ